MRNFVVPISVDTTIVVPTYNEGPNVGPLVRRLATAFAGRDVEVLFVDDSTDDTPARIRQVIAVADLPVRMIHREEHERVGGLAGAVVAGIAATRSAYVLVMDGDLQHPPELAPTLRDAAEGTDLAVASRYAGTGSAPGLSSGYRRLISSGSTALAQACFPRRVGRVCTDPMTGFFCFRREAVDISRLRPRGFKILLEILARHDLRVREIAFTFGERAAGTSKASIRNGLQFVWQMAGLRMGRMTRFAAVGGLGTVLNLAIMALLVHVHLIPYVVASIVAAEVTIVVNFALQERFVFDDLRDGVHSGGRRLVRHLVFNNAETAVRLPFLVLLVDGFGVYSVLAQALTLAAAFGVRFLVISRVVYRPHPVLPTVPVPSTGSTSPLPRPEGKGGNLMATSPRV